MNDLHSAPKTEIDWLARREELRLTEWALHCKLLAKADALLDAFPNNMERASALDIVRLIAQAAALAHAAVNPDAVHQVDLTPGLRKPDSSDALKRIFSLPMDAVLEELKKRALPSAAPRPPTPTA